MALLATRTVSGRHRHGGRWMWLGLWLLAVAPLSAQTDAAREYQVKAVFLFNFAQFVEWPASAFANPAAPLVVGILGADPFGSALDEVVRGESVGTHPLAIKRYARIEDIDTCHILFIRATEGARVDRIAGQLKGRAILTVSDAGNSTQQGIMIRFITDKGRIRLRVNLEASRVAGLQISSKILRHAEIAASRQEP